MTFIGHYCYGAYSGGERYYVENPCSVPDTGADIAFATDVNREDSRVPLFYSRYAKHSLRWLTCIENTLHLKFMELCSRRTLYVWFLQATVLSKAAIDMSKLNENYTATRLVKQHKFINTYIAKQQAGMVTPGQVRWDLAYPSRCISLPPRSPSFRFGYNLAMLPPPVVASPLSLPANSCLKSRDRCSALVRLVQMSKTVLGPE